MSQDKVIITRHPAAAEFIRQAAPEFADAAVIASATPEDVRDRVVAGNLPLHLAALAREVVAVEFTGAPPRGTEYTLADMESAGAVLRRYRVQAIEPAPAPTAPAPTRYEWASKPGPRGRAAFLLLRKGQELREFHSTAIPGWVAVLSATPIRAGLWSHVIYRLALAPGVEAIPGWMGWNTGTLTEGIAQALRQPVPQTWAELAQVLGVPRAEAKRFMREASAKASAALDAAEKALGGLI